MKSQLTIARSNRQRILLALIGAAGVGFAFYVRDPDAAPLAARAGLPALAFDTIVVPGLTNVSDFAVSSNSLFLLDRRAANVTRIDRRAARGWVVARSIGRRGDGPGELRGAHGIATIGDTLIVSSRGMLHYFDTMGGFVRSTRPRLPCAAATLYPVRLDARIALYADCAARDTIVARLLLTNAAGSYSTAASSARFTIDGRLGSHFFAMRAATEAGDRLLFGIGDQPCIDVVAITGTRRLCGSLQKYSSAPPPRLAGRRNLGLAADWPRHLPYYVDRILAGDRILLWRPFSADSVLLEELSTGEPHAVASLAGFVGCRAAGCLWAVHLEQGVQLHWLSVDYLSRQITKQ